MEKISKLRGIRVEVLENQEMKRIVGGAGSGSTGSGGDSGGSTGSGSYSCYSDGMWTGVTYSSKSACEAGCKALYGHGWSCS